MQQEMTKLDNHFRDMVSVSGNQIVTTSLKVAKFFGKRHSHVIRAIESMGCPDNFASAHFWAHEEIKQAGAVKRASKFYSMTKDGFMLLVMGFTGTKAMALKIAYINAFNWMADQLTGRRNELMNQHNEACLEFRMERGVASLAGRTLNRWKSKKPILNERITLIERQMQIPLLLS